MHEGKDEMKYISAIYIFAKKYKLKFAIAEICILITYAVSLFLPLNLAKLVDRVIYAGEHDLLKNVITTYIVLFIVFALTNMLYAYIWQSLYNNFVVDIKCAVYEKVIRAKAEILSNINSGDIMSRIDWDCDQFINAVQRNLFHFINSFVLCAGIVIIIGKINVTIAVISVLAAVLPILFTRFCGKYNEKYSRENREVSGKFTGRLYEILKGYREVKINNSRSWASAQITTALDKLIKLGNTLRRVDFSVNKGVYLLNLSASIGIYIFAVHLISSNILTIGGFLAIISYIALLHRKFNWMLRIYLDWKARKVSIGRVSDVLSYESENASGKEVSVIENIVFTDVSFSYGKNKVLNNVSFFINEGDRVAVVGASGIGKSTIINLLLKLYEVNEGAIKVNGLPINELSSCDLRKAYSVVSQDIILFDDTIRANLLVGSKKNEDEINNALKKVGLLDTVNGLPDGLDTRVNKGFDLSGGQKQRLMIARALLKNSGVFIFDEATSALDVVLEKEIIDNALNKDYGKTVIVISHRYATVRACEKVIVVNDGYIEYAGSIAGAENESAKFREMFKEA